MWTWYVTLLTWYRSLPFAATGSNFTSLRVDCEPCGAPVSLIDCIPRKVRSILDRIQIRKWIGPHAKINVTYVTSVRPWKAWLLSLTLGNQSWLVIWIKCPTQTLNTFSVFPSLQHFASAFCQAGPEASHHLSRRTQGRRYWTPCVHLSQKGRWGIVGITGGSFDIIWYLRPAHLKYFPWQSWWQFRLFRVSLRPDVPRNIVIKHDDRFDLIPDQMDVICFVKRNASDPHLAQDTWLLSMSILWRYADMLVSLSTH